MEKIVKKVLVVRHRKIPTIVYDASTQELLEKAYLDLFKLFNVVWGFYYDIPDTDNLDMKAWFFEANLGKWEAAKALLDYRKESGYSYEDEWELVEVED